MAVGAWAAVMLGATATALELALSGTVPLATVLPAMLGVHALIGIGEAVVTVAAVSAMLASRPDLIWAREPDLDVDVRRPAAAWGLTMRRSSKLFVVLAWRWPSASPRRSRRTPPRAPTAWRRSPSDQGFVEQGTLHAIQDDSPIPDYAFPGIENERLATGVGRLRRHARRVRRRLRRGLRCCAGATTTSTPQAAVGGRAL